MDNGVQDHEHDQKESENGYVNAPNVVILTTERTSGLCINHSAARFWNAGHAQLLSTSQSSNVLCDKGHSITAISQHRAHQVLASFNAMSHLHQKRRCAALIWELRVVANGCRSHALLCILLWLCATASHVFGASSNRSLLVNNCEVS